MSKVHTKHYSLLLQEDNYDSVGEYDEKMMILEEEEEDEGFKAIIGDDDEEEDYDSDDSDEEEIYSSNQHRQLSNEGLSINGPNCYSRKNDYRLLTNNEMDSKNMAFDVPLSNVWTPTPMSPTRRTCFIASIMFGVLVVAMFLWALPCDVEPCEGHLRHSSREWLTEIDNIGINYTNMLQFSNGELGLLVGYYTVDNITEIFSDNSTIDICEDYSEDGDLCNLRKKFFDPSSKNCGILLLNEGTGIEQWRIELHECHSHVHCHLLDVTGDGLNDCLVLGQRSMAVVIEPRKGFIFWHLHSTLSQEEMDVLQFHFDIPLVVHDLNEDGFFELLFPAYKSAVPYSDSGSGVSFGKSYLILVSGKTGEVIGKPLSITQCHRVKEIFSEGDSIGYSCSMENGSDLTGSIPLGNLFGEIIGPPGIHDLLSNNSIHIMQEKEQPASAHNEAVCQIKYINKGKCPFCRTKLQLGVSVENPSAAYDDYEHKSVVSWKVLSSRNLCKGTILKLWKWDKSTLEDPLIGKNSQENYVDTSTFNKRSTRASIEEDSNVDEIPINDSEDFKNPSEDFTVRPIRRLHSKKIEDPDYSTLRNLNAKDSDNNHIDLTESPSVTHFTSGINLDNDRMSIFLPPSGYKLQKVEEVIVLLIFNGSDWVSKDLGSLIIYQLCHDTCLPSHEAQKGSVLLDSDSLERTNWDIYVTSSTFQEVKDPHRNDTSYFLMKSFMRKIVTEVVF